jgi:hypothetical protein
MKLATIIHWKTNHAPGIRCFSERAYADERVLSDGNALADLHEAGDTFVYWPPERGPFPDATTLVQWEQEYDARPEAVRVVADEQEREACKADGTMLVLINQTRAEWASWAQANFPTLTVAERTRIGVMCWLLAVAVRRLMRN